MTSTEDGNYLFFRIDSERFDKDDPNAFDTATSVLNAKGILKLVIDMKNLENFK